MTEPIRFYRTGDPFGEFSNFASFPIEVDGETWPTSEHYFQARKFVRPEDRDEIRREPSPMRAASMGRDRSKPIREDWDEVRDDVMLQALRAKFTQHDCLRELLLSTGTAEIIEHTRNDRYWADGGDGTGRNMLGVLLMRVREELRMAARDR
jgi:ribA/ribD-fused uncharacterized protein